MKLFFTIFLFLFFLNGQDVQIPNNNVYKRGNFKIVLDFVPRNYQLEIILKDGKKIYEIGNLKSAENGFLFKNIKSETFYSYSDLKHIKEGRNFIFATFSGELDIKDNNLIIKSLNGGGNIFKTEIEKLSYIENDRSYIFENDNFIFETKQSRELKIAEEKCNDQREVKLVLINVKDDVYGISSSFRSLYNNECYDLVDFYDLYEYLYQENIDLNKIDEYILRKIGQHFNADKVFFGHSYLVEIPLKYTATTSDNVSGDISSGFDNVSPWVGIIDDVLDIQEINTQKKARNAAINTAGTYVYLTYFSIDVKSGHKDYIYLNNPTIKLD